MSPSLVEKKQIHLGGRFSFDRPSSDTSWPDWQIPDHISSAAHGRQNIRAQSTEEDYSEKHEPAPMQKRKMIVKRRRNPRQPGGWGSTLVIGALIGLASFGIVFDLASDGSIRHYIRSNLLPPDNSEPNNSVASEEPPAPASQEIAKTEEPDSPPIQDTPPAAQIEAAEPEAADVTEQTPAPPPSVETEESAAPDTQLPKPLEPPQVIDDAANQAANQAEPVPSPLPETAPAPQEPAETAEPEITPPPVAVKQQQGDVIRDCATCPELVVVSGGSFTKVDDANPKGPTKTVSINQDFAIGRNDVTFDDWDKCVDDGACNAIAEDSGWGRGSRPLIFVSFDDVTTQYLPWLSKLSGKVYRLPSKDEWQYAELGGAGVEQARSQSSDASQDCFNASGPPAENCADTFNGTAPVGSFPPNALGLHDMRGNVWEWSADCWRPFTYSPNTSPDSCDRRVLLGGAWSSGRSAVNGQISGWEKSNRRTSSIGFRVVRSLP